MLTRFSTAFQKSGRVPDFFGGLPGPILTRKRGQAPIIDGAFAAATGEVVVREGVTIVGSTDLPSQMAWHASQLLSRNIATLLLHLAPGAELKLDWADEITAGACVAGKES